MADACLGYGTDLYGLSATLLHLITLNVPWSSLEGVQALRAERYDKNDPNYDDLSRMRRAKIRQVIKQEVFRVSEIVATTLAKY